MPQAYRFQLCCSRKNGFWGDYFLKKEKFHLRLAEKYRTPYLQFWLSTCYFQPDVLLAPWICSKVPISSLKDQIIFSLDFLFVLITLFFFYRTNLWQPLHSPPKRTDLGAASASLCHVIFYLLKALRWTNDLKNGIANHIWCLENLNHGD